VSDTTVSPAHGKTTVNVTVTTPGGASAAGTAAKFSYLARPAVTGVSPATGSVAGGTTVTLTGTALTGASAVMFGTAPAASFTLVSATQITAVSPAHAKGAVNVTVTTPGGTSAAGAANRFGYVTTAASRRSRASLRNAPQTASTVLASYGYNGDGLRMSQTTGAGTQQFTWDTSQQVPQVLADGSNDYIYGPDGLPIEQISGTGTASYFFHDSNGNTRALFNGNGGVGATFGYTPYGALSSRTGTLTTPLLYGQGYTDATTGLVYLVNRYYDPVTGQFLTVDPAVDQTQQPYSYATGDPVNAADAPGLFSLMACWGICLGWDTNHGPIVGSGIGEDLLPIGGISINTGNNSNVSYGTPWPGCSLTTTWGGPATGACSTKIGAGGQVIYQNGHISGSVCVGAREFGACAPTQNGSGRSGPPPSQTVPNGFPSILEKQNYHQFVGAAYYSYGNSPCNFPVFTA
jgi:RHS repeat-associated protein